jgi:hypothetical protein
LSSGRVLWPFEYGCGTTSWNSPVHGWPHEYSLRATLSATLFARVARDVGARYGDTSVTSWTTNYYGSTRAAWEALLRAMGET